MVAGREKIPRDRRALTVVALGASAADVSAVEAFFRATVRPTGVAFVLILQADDRTGPDALARIRAASPLPVATAADAMALAADHVYMAPPRHHLSFEQGVLRVHRQAEAGVCLSIDRSFRALANDSGALAVGIVLSGAGTAGTRGLGAILGRGGMTMVQAPGSARHTGMPLSAIDAGAADFVLPPPAMPGVLRQYVEYRALTRQASEPAQVALEPVLALVNAKVHQDFRPYSRSMLESRVWRRMAIRQLSRMDDYLEVLRHDPHEPLRLAQDFQRGPSSFFPGPETIHALDREVIGRLLAKPDEQPIRVWITGCDGGEEAYGIAMQLLDGSARVGRPLKLQLFATDIDERALARARAALYPESIAGDVTSDYLQRYFVREGRCYRIAKRVRDAVVFDQHDLITDPPFSRLDLALCRGQLSRLNAEARQRVLSLFSFALNDEGYLLLGAGEAPSEARNLFRCIDASASIYQRVQGATLFERTNMQALRPPLQGPPSPQTPSGADMLAPYVQGLLQERFVPASLVLTGEFEVVERFGQVETYLQPCAADASQNLLTLARRGLRAKLRAAVRRALSEQATVTMPARLLEPTVQPLQITASPLTHPAIPEPLCLVSLQPGVSATAGFDQAVEADSTIAALEQELRAAHEALQSSAEQLESMEASLRNLHDEASRRHEELESSRVALQALNEDLSSVNVALQRKLAQADEAQAELRRDEERYRRLYEQSPSMAFALTADLRIESINAFGAEQLGRSPDTLIGVDFATLSTRPAQTRAVLRAALDSGTVRQWDVRFAGREPLWARCVARAADAHGAPTLVVQCQDLTTERRLSQQLEFHATHDVLTGLVNRREFDAILRRILRGVRKPGTQHVLVRLDLCNFKLINDSAGHEVGDAVLQQFGAVLRQHTRARDIVARLGGDEFGILMEYCPLDEATRVTDGLLAALSSSSFTVGEHAFKLTCYIGMVGIGEQDITAEEVRRRADVASDVSRKDGPGSVRVYDESDISNRRRRTEMHWAGLIRNAIADDAIHLACEPIVATATDRVVGLEMLLRVERQPDAPAVDTGDLIAAAERYGLAPDVDLHVLRLALRDLEANLSRIAALEFVSINVSGQSLGHGGFASEVLSLVSGSRVPAHKLCFEITETATISNLDRAIDFVRQLRSHGCRVAIDDFGSGLASFHYLKSLPCDLVKIDGSFVRDMLSDQASRDLVAAIDGIAKLLGVRTVAEFVETAAIDTAVQQIGVDFRQGPLFQNAANLAAALDQLESSNHSWQTAR